MFTSDVLEAACDYHARGWRVVPIPPGEKGPRCKGWPDHVLSEETLSDAFTSDSNVGVILGPRSRDLVDVDLDCPEALALSGIYLPKTGAEFGRVSKPRSHKLYTAPQALYEAFSDPITGEMMVELRADGPGGGAHQTMFPPSRHPSGELVQWASDTVTLAETNARALRTRVAWLAIGCLMRRYVSEHASERPGGDMPSMLWEFDPELGGAVYRWLNLPSPDEPRPASKYPRHRSEQPVRDLDLAEVVAAIPNGGLSWDEWNRIGLAIYAAAKDDGDGFVVFDDFSAKSSKYDPHTTAQRWAAYKRCPPSRIGMGSLIHAARQAGWVMPRRGLSL